MTNYEYIITQCQKFCNSLWDQSILNDCIEKIKSLSDEERCDLLFEKEVYVKRTYSSYLGDNIADVIEHNTKQDELISAIVKMIPTVSLVEIIHSSPSDYIVKKDRVRSLDFLNTFECAYSNARDELRNRYIKDIDNKIIENAFNNSNESNKEWFKWQKQKRWTAERRYQDSFFKILKDGEIFVDEEFVYHSLHEYDDVISIKGCWHIFDDDSEILNVVYRILNDLCAVVPQYTSLGDEVVLAVASDDFGLESDPELNAVYLNSPLRNKIDEITTKEYNKNLVLGCMLVEKFLRIVDPESNIEVKCYDKEYLLGRFVIEGWYINSVLDNTDIITSIENLAPNNDNKLNSFLDLIKDIKGEPRIHDENEQYLSMDKELIGPLDELPF